MKVIQVVGRSNSGKTTLIQNLVPVLAKHGKVGVIKHLGDHTFALAEGKDTTGFFSAGAAIAVGIDAEKTVAAIRSTSLDDGLRMLFDSGMDFAVIEGFKTHPYPRVVMGDLPVAECILRNPSVPEIVSNLGRFYDYEPPKDGSSRGRGMTA